MITATQLRELCETLQDLIAVAPDTETGRAAVLRAHNLNNVHNLDEVIPAIALTKKLTEKLTEAEVSELRRAFKEMYNTKKYRENTLFQSWKAGAVKSVTATGDLPKETPAAKNWYREWVGLTGELLKAAREIPKESPAYPFIKKAMDIVRDWCWEEEKDIARFCGPANYRSGFNNLAEALKNTPAAKNPMYNRFWVVKTNLIATRDTLIPGTVAHTVITEAIHAIEDWFATVEGTTVTPEIAEQLKGRMWRQGQNPVQVVEIDIDEAEKRVQEKLGCLKQAYSGLGCSENKPLETTPGLSNFYREAISNNLPILVQLYQSKLGNIHLQKEYDGAPVKPNTVVVRLTWWQRNMLRFQVKRLINTLSRKKFEVKQEGKYLVIWQAR